MSRVSSPVVVGRIVRQTLIGRAFDWSVTEKVTLQEKASYDAFDDLRMQARRMPDYQGNGKNAFQYRPKDGEIVVVSFTQR